MLSPRRMHSVTQPIEFDVKLSSDNDSVSYIIMTIDSHIIKSKHIPGPLNPSVEYFLHLTEILILK